MPQLVKKRRSGWAVLAAGALVASLLAVGSGPAGADIDKADHTTALSACVGDAVKDQMFTDVSDEHAFKDAINCIAYYGVTNGTGDGSTYSPNDDVTRAQMAVLIARAAGVAGVDLDDPMGDKFDDIGDTWGGARDAINQLADAGMISSGGDFRPDDAITRGEMAHFLVGLLVKAASNVKIDSAGAIKLGSGAGVVADDYFGDARAALPRANDAEVAALYELGITKGASAAAGAEEGKEPLDVNYEPDGTVNRGQMAAFITRALAHTSARPEGVSAQYADGNVVVSVRDGDFAPVRDAVVDIFHIVTSDAGLAFRANGTCAEATPLGGSYLCEIDNSDEETDNDGDVKADLSVEADTTVWAWTGDTKDTVDGDTDLYRLDIPKQAAPPVAATRTHVSTEHSADLVHLGSSVVYTVQLQSAPGKATTIGTDANTKKPAKFEVLLTTYALVDASDDNTVNPTRVTPSLSAERVKITTDAEGKATFKVDAPSNDPAPTKKQDKYQVDVSIMPGDDAPGVTSVFVGAPDSTTAAATVNGFATVKSGATTQSDGLTFSTAASTRATTGTLTLKTAAEHVAADSRGASNSVTATVTDQYGDPISGARIMLTTSETATVTLSRATRITGSDGARTFRYERAATGAATETLTATWDPDGGAFPSIVDAIEMTETVEWAQGAETANDQSILEFDTDTDTIFAGTAGSVYVFRYDSNDRFNTGAAGSETATSYAAFERALAKGLNLDVIITGSRSSATNTYTLSTS